MTFIASPVEFDFLESLNLDPMVDRSCDRLSRYLQQGMNWYMERLLPGTIAVRDVESHDGANVDLSRFPLLKVYRHTDTYPDSFASKTSATIAYCLSFQQQENLPGICNWASKTINALLRHYSLRETGCHLEIPEEEIRAEYGIMVNTVTQFAYPFLRVNFNFQES